MSDARSLAELGFVHIPKNAGTSIVRAIVDNALPIRHADHSYPARLGAEEFVVLRSPYDRFVSAFDYERRYWANAVNASFADADELARSAGDPAHPKHALARVELGNEPEHFLQRNGRPTPPHTVGSRPTAFTWIFEPQSTWLVNEPRHLLRYDRLAEDFSALLAAFGWRGTVEQPRLNRSGGEGTTLSEAARGFIEHTSRADFEFMRARGLEA